MKLPLFLVLVPLAVTVFSQDSARVRLVSLSSSVGFSTVTNANTIIEDLQAITKEDSELLYADLVGFEGGSYSSMVGPSVSTRIGMTLPGISRHFPNHHPELELGLLFQGGNGASHWYTQEETISSTSELLFGEVYRLDSIVSETYSFWQRGTNIAVSAAFLFGANPERSFGVSGGFGMMLSYGINHRVDAWHSVDTMIDLSRITEEGDRWIDRWSGRDGHFESEIIRTVQPLYTRLYIPLTISFRLAKRSSFFKHIKLKALIKGGVEVRAYPGVRSEVNSFMNMEWGVGYVL